MSRPASRQLGFSLLEVLVAFSILALSLGVLMQIFSRSLGNLEVVGDQAVATDLAQSLLASIGAEIPATPGEALGRQDKYDWRVTISPYDDTADGGTRMAIPPLPNFAMYQVAAEVSWNAGRDGRIRQLALTTLRLLPAGTP